MRVLWSLLALLVLLPAASAQAAPPTCTSNAPKAEDDGRPTGVLVGCRGALDVPLHVRLVSGPQHGELAGFEERTWPTGDSSFDLRYTPDAGHRGSDTFTVRATAGGESTDHDVTITVVAAIDDPPMCFASWTNAPPFGPPRLDAGELSYGHLQCGDDEGATLTPTVLAPPQHGVLGDLKPLGVFAGVSFTYRPDLAHRGRDQFTLRVVDGPHTVDTILLVDVVAPTDDAPTCSPPLLLGTDRHAVAHATATELPWVCGDPEGALLSFTVVTPPAHGTVTLSAPDRFGVRATYTPAAGHAGPDAFTLRAQDGAHVLEHTFKVLVGDAPPVTTPEPTVQPDPPVATNPLIVATGSVGPAAKPVSSLDRRIAKVCGKLKGAKKTTCAKRERALAKCGAMKSRTSKQKAAKRRCTAKAKLIGAKQPRR